MSAAPRTATNRRGRRRWWRSRRANDGRALPPNWHQDSWPHRNLLGERTGAEGAPFYCYHPLAIKPPCGGSSAELASVMHNADELCTPVAIFEIHRARMKPCEFRAMTYTED